VAYEGQWLNRFEQFGTVTYTLLLHDPDGVLPDVRVEKSFPATANIPALKATALDAEVDRLAYERAHVIDARAEQLRERTVRVQDELSSIGNGTVEVISVRPDLIPEAVERATGIVEQVAGWLQPLAGE
jgi:hypothetical protein